jgi:hypothetical protein
MALDIAREGTFRAGARDSVQRPSPDCESLPVEDPVHSPREALRNDRKKAIRRVGTVIEP